MLNNVVLVGRLLEIRKEQKQLVINSQIDKDTNNFVLITIDNDNIIEKVVAYCKVGDVVGVKGKVINRNNENIVLCEKISFLTSSNDVEKQEA